MFFSVLKGIPFDEPWKDPCKDPIKGDWGWKDKLEINAALRGKCGGERQVGDS